MGPVCLICLPSCLVLVGLEWMKGLRQGLRSMVHLFRFPTLHPLGGPHPPGVDTNSALNESPKTSTITLPVPIGRCSFTGTAMSPLGNAAARQDTFYMQGKGSHSLSYWS